MVARQSDAKKERFEREAALRLAREATELVVMKGKKVVRVPITPASPSDDELAALILGPSGTLRAPALRRGGTLLIGFEPGAYAEALHR